MIDHWLCLQLLVLDCSLNLSMSFVKVTSLLSLTNSEKWGVAVSEAERARGRARTSNRAGGGAFSTVESVHSHMPRQEGEKEQAMAAVS